MFRSFARIALVFPLVLSISQVQTFTQSGSQATTLASQSLQAAVGATALADATLEGTVNYTAGSDEESGNFTLEVKGNQESKLTLSLSGSKRTEIRQAQNGAWVDTQGVQHLMELQNCWVDASILFPTFSIWGALNDPNVSTVYLGQGAIASASADQLQLSRVLPNQSAAVVQDVEMQSAMNIYLDSSTHLPVAVTFNEHPDVTSGINVPVEVLFANYQTMGGILVPTHIQKLVQGTLTLDFTVTNVTVNTGIPDSAFSIQ